jgi:hypothetical protein
VGVATDPFAPETMVQEPVPMVGALPASVTLVNPQVEAPV